MTDNAALDLIQQQNWLEPVEEGLQKSLETAFKADTGRGRPVENALHGVWLGHALHPVLTDLPVGAWSVVCVLDLVEEFTGARKYRAGADAALNIGLVGAAGAAITGLTDWKDVHGQPRRTGVVHGLLNLAAAGLYLASSIQRSNGKRGAARGLAYAAYGVVFASAWLGGHLVYVDQLGVEHKALAEPPDDWTAVAGAGDLKEGEPRRVEVKGFPIVLVKKGERVFALAEVCTHLGGPLSEGKVEGDCIRCPWHGSTFRLDDGSVVESPATRPAQSFEARERNGQIELRSRKV